MIEFLERSEEFCSLGSALDGAKEGRGAVVIVGGPPGCGNSSLLKACVVSAGKAGAVLLDAIASPAERGIQFGVVEQLFQHAELPVQYANLLESVREEGERLAVLPGSPTARPEIRTEILYRLYGAVMRISRQVPVMIVVDDLQYADAASLQFLLFLARRVRKSKILIVVAESAYMASVDAEFQAELLRLPHSRYLRLAPLTPHGVGQLLAELMGEDEAERLTDVVYDISGGNPVLVHALARDYMDARRTAESQPASLSPGERFRQSVRALLYRGEFAVLRLAQCLALLGEDAPLAVLSGVVGVAADITPRAIRALEGAGLIRKGRFRHAAVRSAVREGLSPDEVADLSHAVARTLYEDGAPASAVARHLLAGGVRDARWAVRILEEAADDAQSQNQSDLAIKCLELAHASCQEDDHRARIKAKMAGVAWRVRPTTAARHLPQLIDAVRAGHLDRGDTVALVRHLLWHGWFDEAIEALERLSESADRLDRRTASELGLVQLTMSVNYPALVTRSRLVPPLGKDSGGRQALVNPRLQGAALLNAVLRRGVDPSTVVQAEQILQRVRLGEKGPEAVEPAALALLALIYADRLDVAEPWCVRLLAEEPVKRSPSWMAHLGGVHAEIALRRGNLRAAVRFADTAFSHMPMPTWGVGLGFPLSAAVLATTHMGQHDKAAELLAHPVPDAMFQTRYGLHYLYARGHHYLATGSHYAALADFLSCGELMGTWGLDFAGLVPWRTGAAQAWLRLDDLHQARSLVKEQLARLGTGRSRTRAATLRVLAATVESAQATQILTEAVEILEGCGDRLELAWTLADLSRRLHTAGQRSRARMVSRRADKLATECGALSLGAQLQAGQEGLGAGCAAVVHGVDRLSDAELRVASLAAQGMTNREIAGKLFITTSTVEQHLTQVYRKLNVKHRRELPVGLENVMSETA